MKCREIIDILETLAPKSCACDWDNPGLLAGRMDKDVKKILLTLDADDAAVERAKEIGAYMLLSHHPLPFSIAHNVIIVFTQCFITSKASFYLVSPIISFRISFFIKFMVHGLSIIHLIKIRHCLNRE